MKNLMRGCLLVVALLTVFLSTVDAQINHISFAGSYNMNHDNGFGSGFGANIGVNQSLNDRFLLSNDLFISNEKKTYATGGFVLNNTSLVLIDVAGDERLRYLAIGGVKIAHYEVTSPIKFNKTGIIPIVGAGVRYKNRFTAQAEWHIRTFNADPSTSGARLYFEYLSPVVYKNIGFKVFNSISAYRYNQVGDHVGINAGIGAGIYIALKQTR